MDMKKMWRWICHYQIGRKSRVLALGGGGARGFAHVGVIKVLEKMKWRPDLITGTSMGSIIGALYALYGDAGEVEERIYQYTGSDWFNELGVEKLARLRGESGAIDSIRTFIKYIIEQRFGKKGKHPLSIFSSSFLPDILNRVFGNLTFDDLRIPFIAVATDLYSGRNLELNSGPLVRAVTASSSIPGIFSPVKYKDMLLVDGSVTRNIPIPSSAEYQSHKIIAVDIQPALESSSPLKNPLDVIYRVDDITNYHLNRFYLGMADVIIEPPVRDIDWDDFSDIGKMIEAGEQAAADCFSGR